MAEWIIDDSCLEFSFFYSVRQSGNWNSGLKTISLGLKMTSTQQRPLMQLTSKKEVERQPPSFVHDYGNSWTGKLDIVFENSW